MGVDKDHKDNLLLRLCSRVHSNKGLTLIEMLVAVVVSSIVGAAAVSLHISQQKIFTKEESLTNMRNSVRSALDIVTKDLRMAGYNPEESINFEPGICDANKGGIHFVMDIDTNGVLNSAEKLGFQLSGDTLYKLLFSTPTTSIRNPIAINIDYFELRYFNSDGDTIPCPVDSTELANIYKVRVFVVGRTEREFSHHHEQGQYPDGTTYDDRRYRYWLRRNIKLRNI